ncbi:hypothetical protein MTO96_024750 [Rhipicephalus appendiculatus]
MKQIPGYQWNLFLRTESQYIISFHMTNEAGARPDNYWGQSSFFQNFRLPRATIGILTCDLIDSTKE